MKSLAIILLIALFGCSPKLNQPYGNSRMSGKAARVLIMGVIGMMVINEVMKDRVNP